MKDNIFVRTVGRFGLRLDRFIAGLEEGVADLLGGIRQRARKTKAKAVSPEVHKRAAGELKKGRGYYNDKRYKKAIRYFRLATKTDEGYALAHYYLGLALYKTYRLKAALISWQRAIDVDPKSEAADKAREKLGSENLGKNRTVKISGVDD